MKISTKVIREAVDNEISRTCGGWTDRAANKAGGWDKLIRARIQTVGDIRMLQNDVLDAAVAWHEASEPVEVIGGED